MKLSELPAKLEAWLLGRLPAFSTLTVEPRIGERSLFIPPVSSVAYGFSDGALRGDVLQPVYIQLGLPGGGLYSAVDQATVNALYQGLSLEMVLRAARIDDSIQTALPQGVEDPIKLEPTSNDKGWVCTLYWLLNISFIADAEEYEGITLGGPFDPSGPDTTPFDPDQVNVGIWKAPLVSDSPLDNAVLDLQL